jgi:hypothetical protein
LKIFRDDRIQLLKASLEADPQDYTTQALLHELEAEINDADLISARKAQEALHSAWITDGDCCSKIFFSLLRLRSSSNRSEAVCDRQGSTLTGISDILLEATRYYKFHLNEDLSSQLPSASRDRASLLSNFLNTLDPALAAELNAPISAEEVSSAINAMPRGRVPGPDGIPSKFFQVFSDLTVPLLVAVFNDAWDAGVLPPDFLLGDIVLLPKKGDPAELNNKRPITLLNSKYKLFAKVWQKRLTPIAQQLIQ